MRTNDGTELTGRTPAEIVRELHKMSRAPCATDAEFMHQMAGRVALTIGQRIPSTTTEEFVAALIACGTLLEE